MDEIKKIGVIGAGSFGTALAMTLTQKGHEVTLWARRTEQIEEMRRTRQNPRYLPEIPLPETLDLTDDLQEAVTDKNLLLMAVPAQTFRGVFTQVSACMDARTPIVNVAKGIEKGSLLRLSEVACQILPEVRYAALSGPDSVYAHWQEETYRCDIPWHQSRPECPVLPRYNLRYFSGQNRQG